MIEETDENHGRVDEAARAFLSDLRDAISESELSAEGDYSAVNSFRTSDTRRRALSSMPLRAERVRDQVGRAVMGETIAAIGF